MKKNIIKAMIFTAACLNIAHAEDAASPSGLSVAGIMTLASDYHWRGISLSQNEPAVQGGLTLCHKSGAYAGVWASSTDVLNGASIEADFMLGYRYALNDSSSLTVQYLDVNYPGAKTVYEPDFSEFSLAYSNFGVINSQDAFTASVAYSNDYYFESGNMLRLDARYSYNVLPNFGVFGAWGLMKLEDEQAFARLWGNNQKDHYYDWKLGVSSNLLGLYSELYYADNSTVNSAVDSMDSRVVFSVTKAF